MPHLEYKIRLATEKDLSLVIKLQRANHYKSISDQDKTKEGFVSVETSLSTLKTIRKEIGVVVADLHGKIIGYEFPISLDQAKKIDLLKPFLTKILELNYGGKKLLEYQLVIEGQICVDKNYKGKGIAEKLHKKFVELLKNKFDLMVTEISDQNPRSLYVHKNKLGLQIINEYTAEGKNWYVLIRDLRD